MGLRRWGLRRWGLGATIAGMIVLPMLRTPATADGWHAVTAPGGYETWQVTAEDAGRGVLVIARLGQGYDYEPSYQRRYERYRRRPTRVAPPVPAGHAWTALTVVREGRVIVQWRQRVPPDAFAAAEDGLDVRVGGSRLRREADGSIRLEIEGEAGRRAELVMLGAVMLGPVMPRRGDESADWVGNKPGVHQWWAAPSCALRGKIADGGATINIEGRACVEHGIGTGPRGGVRRWWMRGRVLAARSVILIELEPGRDVAVTARGIARGIARVIEIDETGERKATEASVGMADPGGRGVMLEEVRIGEVHLRGGREIERVSGRVGVVFEATTAGGVATAVCEIVRPRRWRWPL